MSETFDSVPFISGTVPYCVWGWGVKERNLQYLQGIDPQYFDYIGETNQPNLSSDDGLQRQRAAIVIRAAYHQGLETFFALLFATLQSPWCVVGWMQTYSPDQLRNMAKAIDPSLVKGMEQKKRAYAERERLQPYIAIRPRNLPRWDGISRVVHGRVNLDQESKREAQELFGRRWSRFAQDLVNASFVAEYNSIKHGLRARAGGFRLAAAPQPASDETPSPDQMHVLADSEHGSSFFMPQTFTDSPTEKAKRPKLFGKNRDANFRIRKQALNWDPERLCASLTVLSASIANVKALALTLNGHNTDQIQFLLPTKETFDEASAQPAQDAASSWDAHVWNADVEGFDHDEIQASLRENVGRLRQHLDPSATEHAQSDA